MMKQIFTAKAQRAVSAAVVKTLRSMGFKKSAIIAIGIIAFGVMRHPGHGAQALPETESVSQEEMTSPYTLEVEPLTTADCGRCHTGVFRLIKEKGGKHQIDCRKCHVQFHVFRPGRGSYEAVLPNCETCHGAFHGDELLNCLACHKEAHAPLDIPAERSLELGCAICHEEAEKEIRTFVTQHSEFYCFSCHHTRHRNIPECMACHQPHSEEMTQSDCLACHPPHKALEVVYPEDIPKDACAGCHRRADEMLAQSGSKHAALTCARCHPKHRGITRCVACHPEPHSAGMLQEFSVCGRCHGEAHSLIQ